MIYLQNNLRFLRKQKEWTQGQLADKLGIKRALIGAYEEGRAVPKLLVIQQLSLIFDLSIDQLLTLDLSQENYPSVQNNLRVLSTVVDSQNEERICIVPVKASAGYLNGLSDPEFVAELPHFALPVKELSQQRTYRVFQIIGDSMLPVPDGAYIFCAYVEALNGIRNGKPYVVITANEGIVYKRVFMQSEENGKLLLKSDNSQYAPYSIEATEVLEVWQALGFLTFDLPEPAEMDLNTLTTMVYNLQGELNQLKNKI